MARGCAQARLRVGQSSRTHRHELGQLGGIHAEPRHVGGELSVKQLSHSL